MTPFKQYIDHDPENGYWGDCYRTAIGCLLDIHPLEIPHFAHGDTTAVQGSVKGEAWLNSIGWSQVDVVFTCTLDEVLNYMDQVNPTVYYMLSGSSPRGFNHTAIACGGDVVWDPSHSGAGITGPMNSGQIWVTFLVPLTMCNRRNYHE